MAVVNRLVVSYVDDMNEARALSFKGVRSRLDGSLVKYICSTLQSNGSIYAKPIVTVTGAKLVTTDETEYEI